MNIDEIKAKVQSEEYNFLRENPLGDNIILLGLAVVMLMVRITRTAI